MMDRVQNKPNSSARDSVCSLVLAVQFYWPSIKMFSRSIPKVETNFKIKQCLCRERAYNKRVVVEVTVVME
jgi:hypothetical protein